MRLQRNFLATPGLLAVQRAAQTAHQLDWSEGNYGNFILQLRKKSLKLQIIAIMQKKFAMKSFTRSNLTRAFNQMEKEFEDKPKRKFMKKFWTLLSGMVFEIFLEFWITFESCCLYFNLIFEV